MSLLRQWRGRVALVAWLVASGCVLAGDATVGLWRMEGTAGAAVKTLASEVNADAMQATVHGEAELSSRVAAPYIYDPATGRPQANRTSLSLKGDAWVEIPFRAGSGPTAGMGSFTFEMLVNPSGDPRKTVFGVAKSRLSPAAAGAWVGANFLRQWGQTYYSGSFTLPNGRPETWSTGPYTSISRINEKTLGWRHLALVYDAERKRATCILDHWQAEARDVAGVVTWDDGSLCIGGGPRGGGFVGEIDEVRVTRAALPPEQFLWARHEPIRDVQFASQETVLPRGTGYIDLKTGFGAVGDGKTDDTRAFQRAFAACQNLIPLAFHTLYVAPGTYLVSDTIRWSRYLVLQGAGRDRTVIRLKDRCPGYQDGSRPKPVLKASSTAGPPGSNRQCNGSSMSNYAFDLSIDTGTGNAGAVGFEYHTNNFGTVENVAIRSGDGRGAIGLDLRHNCVGPALIKRVRIEGFDYAAQVRYQEYSLTFEHIELAGQRVAGIHNAGNIVALRGIRSVNRVPAVVGKGGNSMIALLDSELKGGAADQAAVQSDGGLVVRNLATEGYRAAIEKRIEIRRKGQPTRWTTRTVEGPRVETFVGDQVVSSFGERKAGLGLPVEETPEVPRGDIHRDWASIMAFAGKAVRDARGRPTDWAPAIQAAIDSGAATVYFPWRHGGYPVGATVHLRGRVARLFGMRTGIGRTKAMGDQPAVVYDQPDAGHVAVIERLSVAGIRHASPATLVLKHGNFDPYTNAPGCGKLFMEDTNSSNVRFEHPQRAWVRHWNPESHSAGPCVVNRGATLWSLGFKTEYESEKLAASHGARTEIFGAFIYPIGKIPPDRPIFRNTDSHMAVMYGTSVYRANHKVHIIDTQHGETRRVGNDRLKWSGSRARMDLYVSTPE